VPEDEDDDGGAFMIQTNKAYDLFVCAKKAFDKYCMMLFLHILDFTVLILKIRRRGNTLVSHNTFVVHRMA
jgi:hypothetical protein